MKFSRRSAENSSTASLARACGKSKNFIIKAMFFHCDERVGFGLRDVNVSHGIAYGSCSISMLPQFFFMLLRNKTAVGKMMWFSSLDASR
jgi:hypothetical protein